MVPPAADHEKYQPFLDQQRWDDVWELGINPGFFFDKVTALPELAKQLSNGTLPTSGRALVPGCGRGYDVEILCRAGYTATGLDISPTALSAAREYLESVATPGEYRMICDDFFTAAIGEFDLVYDYTFLCALPPERRAEWGKRMGELVKKDGSLITVMFPMNKDLEEGGPPFGVSEKAYRDLLGHNFVPVDGPRELDEGSAHPDRGGGRTWWCRWKRVADQIESEPEYSPATSH